MARTFRRGTHPPTHKRYQDYPLEDFKVPDKLYVSLSQHIGAPAKAVVSIGDVVKEGQLIGPTTDALRTPQSQAQGM